MERVFVDVTANISKDGVMSPLSFIWKDGERYEVDKVIDIKPAASLKVGGCGIRYKCRVLGRETYLFWDGLRWFMEGKA